MGLPFHILDVFTNGEPMSGNQLLVVEDREDTLSTAAMQKIAKEIGFAESAFVRKPAEGTAASVRIFTTDQEVPQAGHPIIGLSEVVGRGLDAAAVDAQDCTKAFAMQTRKGPITVRQIADGQWFASQDPAEWLGFASKQSVAVLLQGPVDAVALIGDAFPIGSTCGLPYALVSMASEAALDGLDVNPAASPEAFFSQCDLPNPLAIYFYFRTSDTTVRTRMFCHEGGLWIEDVATGSAAGPLAAHLAPIRALFMQGSSRRAHIHVNTTARERARIDIGGAVLRVAHGTWTAIPS